MQQKTSRPVPFDITEQTRTAVADWMKARNLHAQGYLFPSRVHDCPHLGTRQYARIVDGWVKQVGLESTLRSLGIEVDDALEMAEETDIQGPQDHADFSVGVICASTLRPLDHCAPHFAWVPQRGHCERQLWQAAGENPKNPQPRCAMAIASPGP